MPLKRPPTQQLQEESFNAIHSIINNEMNCQFRSLTPDNSGIDCEIELVKAGNMSAKLLKGQIKAGKSYIYSETDKTIKIRLEKKYLDHWNAMNLPVILFYYHPDTKTIFWKSIKDYLVIESKLLKKLSKTILISFDKERDVFSKNTLEKLQLIIDGKFKYEKFIFTTDEKEIIWSNWFHIESLPEFIYEADMVPSQISKLSELFEDKYVYLIKANKILIFLNLQDRSNELRNFIVISSIKKKSINDIDQNYLVEILNKTLVMNLINKNLKYNGERFYFKRDDLTDDANNKVTFSALRKEHDSSRKLVTVRKKGDEYEFTHLACKIHIISAHEKWYLEIEPDYQFSYSSGNRHSRKEIGIRITQAKASMFNQEYLYLLHFWRQFLANDEEKISLIYDQNNISKKILIDKNSLNSEASFQIFNDYKEVTKS